MMLYGHEAPAIVWTACRSSIIVPTCIICASCEIKPANSRNRWPKQLGRKKHLQPHQTSFCGQAVIRPCQVADSFDLQHGVLRCFTASVLSGQMRRELSLLTFRRDLSGHGETNWKHDMHESGNANTMENPKSTKKIEKGILGHLILASRLRWNWRDKRL